MNSHIILHKTKTVQLRLQSASVHIMITFIVSTLLLTIISALLIMIIYKVRSNISIPKGPYLWISNLSTFTLFLIVPVGLILGVTYNYQNLAEGKMLQLVVFTLISLNFR